jgi:hypothetical protein
MHISVPSLNRFTSKLHCYHRQWLGVALNQAAKSNAPTLVAHAANDAVKNVTRKSLSVEGALKLGLSASTQ